MPGHPSLTKWRDPPQAKILIGLAAKRAVTTTGSLLQSSWCLHRSHSSEHVLEREPCLSQELRAPWVCRDPGQVIRQIHFCLWFLSTLAVSSNLNARWLWGLIMEVKSFKNQRWQRTKGRTAQGMLLLAVVLVEPELSWVLAWAGGRAPFFAVYRWLHPSFKDKNYKGLADWTVCHCLVSSSSQITPESRDWSQAWSWTLIPHLRNWHSWGPSHV